MFFQLILASQFLEDNQTSLNKIKELDGENISKSFLLKCTSEENIKKVIKYIKKGYIYPLDMNNHGNLETIYKKLKF